MISKRSSVLNTPQFYNSIEPQSRSVLTIPKNQKSSHQNIYGNAYDFSTFSVKKSKSTLSEAKTQSTRVLPTQSMYESTDEQSLIYGVNCMQFASLQTYKFKHSVATGQVFFKILLSGFNKDVEQLKQKLRRCLKLSNSSFYILDQHGNEILDFTSLIHSEYFIVCERCLLQGVNETSLAPYIQKHKHDMPCYNITIKSEYSMYVRSNLQDSELQGLPSLRNLQDNIESGMTNYVLNRTKFVKPAQIRPSIHENLNAKTKEMLRLRAIAKNSHRLTKNHEIFLHIQQQRSEEVQRLLTQSPKEKLLTLQEQMQLNQQNEDYLEIVNKQKKESLVKLKGGYKFSLPQLQMPQEIKRTALKHREVHTVNINPRKVISKFDPKRPDRVYRQQTKIDYIRQNAFELIKPSQCVQDIIKMNFTSLCHQQLADIENHSSLKRSEIIHLYTQFVGMFLSQEIQHFENRVGRETRRFEEINKVSVDTIKNMSKLLKFQSGTVVDCMIKRLLKNSSGTGMVEWQALLKDITYLIPVTLSEKINVFVRCYEPKNVFFDESQDYLFSQQEIIQICKESLNILFVEFDDFADQLTINLAKSIYLIIGQNWEDQTRISMRRIEASFKQANDLEVKMLSLLFGTIGLINIDQKKDIFQKLIVEKNDNMAQEIITIGSISEINDDISLVSAPSRNQKKKISETKSSRTQRQVSSTSVFRAMSQNSREFNLLI